MIAWLEWYPPVGVFIGILGLLGVLVPLLRDLSKIGRGEKAAWTAIVFILAGLEIRSIYLDRDAHDREQAAARAEQLTQFGKIAKGIGTTIATSQEHFDATMAKSDKLMGLSKESLDNITGGNSYAYVAAMMSGPMGPPFQLSVWVRGKHGVHDLRAEIQPLLGGTDAETMKRQFELTHVLRLGNGDFLPGFTSIDETVTSGRYAITIISRNQWISEELDIAKCSDGNWSEAINLNGVGQKENKNWRGRPGCNQPF